MKKLIVKLEDKTKKISVSKYIQSIFKNVPYSAICKALRNKDIRVNNVKISNDTLIQNNDSLEIYITDNILFNLPKEIKYYYEDENIIIAFKPQGILSNNEDMNSSLSEPTLEDLIIKDKCNHDIRICHRLDRNTAGLIIFTKNEDAYTEILNGFKEGKIHKEYITYVTNSNFSKPHNILEAYLTKDAKTGYSKISQIETKNSEKIITEYTVLEKNTKLDYAKLKVILHTGKTHQIRAHLASVNHPVIGDSKYGKNDINKKFKKNRQMLFAYKYSFSFDNKSILNYLNKFVVELEKEITEFQ